MVLPRLNKSARLCAMLRDSGPLTFNSIWKFLQRDKALKQQFKSRNHTKEMLRQLIRNKRVKVFRDRSWEKVKTKQESSFRFQAIRLNHYKGVLPPRFNTRAEGSQART